MDAKLGGGLSSLPTIAIQKVAINHLSQQDSDLINDDLSQFPNLGKNGHQRNGISESHLHEKNGLSINGKHHRFDPLGLKLPLSPNGKSF